jgi:hypothetical protein
MDMIGDKKDALIDLFKADIPFVSQSAAAKLITKYNMKGDEINKLKEEVELDEIFNGTKQDLRKIARATDNALKKRSAQIQKMLKSKTNEKGRGLTDFEFDHISDEGDATAAELAYRKKNGKNPISDDIPPHLKKYLFGEEVELGEAKFTVKYDKNGKNYTDIIMAKDKDDAVQKALNTFLKGIKGNKFSVRPVREEVEIDEASKEGTIKIIKTKDGKFQIQKMTKGKFVDMGKPYNSAKEAEKFRSGQPDLFGEASAAADARRAISKDRDFGRKRDSADKDDVASDDDVKAASKNIMMQLRKSVNRASRGVEFGDKKKVQVDPKIAQAVISKYNSLRRPSDKEIFQAKIAKSYKDMLKALKESTIKESKFGVINKQLKGEK